MIHNDFADTGAIARSAKWQAEIALDAGWDVTLVAAHVDPDLLPCVEHRALYVPPRIHLVQWLAARPTIRRAKGDRAYDLVVAHQPQVAALADVWHVRFLSRPNVDADGLPRGGSPRDVLRRTELRAVAAAEDRYLRRLPATTHVVFHSAALLDVYSAYYQTPPSHSVIANPGPDPRTPADETRRAESRHSLSVPPEVFVIGFLGGTDPRKGGDRLLRAVREHPELHVLFAGSGSDEVTDHALGTRLHRAGFLDRARTADFYDAIDLLAVPSRFEPWGVVVNEAAAAGTPVIVTPEVGAGSAVAEHRAGLMWNPATDDLAAVIEVLRADLAGYRARAHEMARELSFSNMAPRFLSLYRTAMERKRRR